MMIHNPRGLAAFNVDGHTTGKNMYNGRPGRHPAGHAFDNFHGNFEQMQAAMHFTNNCRPAGGMYDDQDGMISGVPHNVGQHLIHRDQ